MSTLVDIKTLIDKAATHVQTKSALSRLLGVSPQRINDWAHGHVGCPLKVQVRLCDVAGLDDHETREHLREAANVEGPKHQAGARASIAMAVVGAAVSAAAFISECATMYIM